MPQRHFRFVKSFIAVLLIPTLSMTQATGASDSEWGTLTGRFVFDGDAPEIEKLSLNKDIEICSKTHPLDESLLVNQKNRGLANVIVTLMVKRSEKLPAVHPSYEKSAGSEVTLTNKECRFVPHVTLLRTSQTLVLGNDDPIAHSTLVFTTYNTPFNEAIRQGSLFRRNLPKPETRPSAVTCPIHSWMKAFIVVTEHPYAAFSNADGKFTIRDLPVGAWKFQIWHERSKYVKRIRLAGNEVEDRKGLYQMQIKPGANDLGEIIIDPATLAD